MMPYKCARCGHTTANTILSANSPERQCCGEPMDMNVPPPSRPAEAHVTGRFQKPIEMHSVGTNDPDEIARLRRECPGVEIADDPRHPDYGVPKAHTRQEKLKVLKACGFVERN